MILMVSQRTDIPAFYPKWFINRLKKGYVLVKNPFNYKQVSHISLSKDVIDCICFLTKNPIPLIPYLDELKDIPYFFHITVTGYGNDIEKRVLDKRKIINSIIELSKKIGKNRIFLRYDPILITDKYSLKYHEKALEKLIVLTKDYVKEYIISFVDVYDKLKTRFLKYHISSVKKEEIIAIAEIIQKLADKYSVKFKSCVEEDLSDYGIYEARCIDKDYIEDLIGFKIMAKKNKNRQCDCLEVVDIGTYNTCLHECLYCYANNENIFKNVLKYDVDNDILCASLDDVKITKRNVKSLKCKPSLF